jgi:hypothetical protein
MMNDSVRVILIIAVNPAGTERLRLDREVKAIEQELERSEQRKQFQVKSAWAIDADDLQRKLLQDKPSIVHFAGHGEGEQGLVLEGVSGKSQLVETQAIARLFELCKEYIECAVLNACYSEVQAEAIHQHIDCVIGMKQGIGDGSAAAFSKGFYRSLGAGGSYQAAYNFGCNAIALERGTLQACSPTLYWRARQQSRIFISYKRDSEPDGTIVTTIRESLGQECEIVIDQMMDIGIEWAKWVETKVSQSDFMVVLLSEQSVRSEMVRAEVEKARQLFEQQGFPKILPVRLAYRHPLAYPLSGYINDLNWAIWDGESDTPHLIEHLRRTIAGSPQDIKLSMLKPESTLGNSSLFSFPQPSDQLPSLDIADQQGIITLQSKFYVERDSDTLALNCIQRAGGVTLTIKGSRQMGKSSLLIRVLNAAEVLNRKTVLLDFDSFERSTRMNETRFFREFCMAVADGLHLEDGIDEYWERDWGNPLRCSSYMNHRVLEQLNDPLTLVMDNVEKISDSGFQSDFFAMLRTWHNKRASQPIWRRLDLVFSTSTEPYQLIENMNQSPFNVGTLVELRDLNITEVTDLNRRYGNILNSSQIQLLMDLLSGHPYLVQQAFSLIASGQAKAVDLLNPQQAVADGGFFGDHLKYHLFKLQEQQMLSQGMLQVIRHQTCSDERLFFLLQGAGLVKRKDSIVLPRCQLYASYFKEKLRA